MHHIKDIFRADSKYRPLLLSIQTGTNPPAGSFSYDRFYSAFTAPTPL